jgi:hypothetical protein
MRLPPALPSLNLQPVSGGLPPPLFAEGQYAATNLAVEMFA